jgi:hypothetical protein
VGVAVKITLMAGYWMKEFSVWVSASVKIGLKKKIH